jgi:hypothetical protein
MQTSDAQVNVQAGLFKADADIEERLASVVTDACAWFSNNFKYPMEVTDLREAVKDVIEELMSVADNDDAKAHAISLIEALKVFLSKCPGVSKLNVKDAVAFLDNALGQLLRGAEPGKGGLLLQKVSANVVAKVPKQLPNPEEVREVVAKTFRTVIAEPFSIVDLHEAIKKKNMTAFFDAKKHRYEVHLKVRNKFTGMDNEIVITLPIGTVNAVLVSGPEYDKEHKKGKNKEEERKALEVFFSTPKILRGYIAEFLKCGLLPTFSSISFVKAVLDLTSREDSTINTTREELRSVLVRGLKTFKFATVKLKDGKRLYDPLIVDNLKDFVYIDDTSKELIVPSRFFAELEVKSMYKTALIKLLLNEGILKNKHTTYTFRRSDNPDEEGVVLNVAVFDLNKLKELLGFDPAELMKESAVNIRDLLEAKQEQPEGGVNDQQ